MAGPNRVVPPLKVGPDGTFDDRYWPRTEPLPVGPEGPEGPEGPQGPKAVIVSTTEPPVADPGDLWYNPEADPEHGDPVGLTKTEADQYYPPKDEVAALRQDVDAVADVPPRVEAVETQVARVTPSSGRTIVGGPTGPIDTLTDSVSADWFSDINAAIAAARTRRGGGAAVVRLSANTTYTMPDPIGVYSGLTLIGEDPMTTMIRATGEAGIRVGEFGQRCEAVHLSGFRLWGNETAPVGIDMRGFYKSYASNFLVTGCDVGLWLGGDLTTYHSCWSNVIENGDINTKNAGTGVRLSGQSGLSGFGSSTANHNRFSHVNVNLGPDIASVGYDIQQGDTNLIEGCDVGYASGPGIPFKLSTGANYNTIAFNRTEDVERSVYLNGASFNRFLSNHFGGSSATYHPVELESSGTFNVFRDNTYSQSAKQPRVKIGAGVTYTETQDINADKRKSGLAVESPQGTVMLSNQVPGEPFERFRILGSGTIEWLNPATGARLTRMYLGATTAPYIKFDPGTYVMQPEHATLPAANANRLGAIIRVPGGPGVADKMYIHVKDANDQNVWKEITLA